jgi:hypothetical protein
MGVTTSPEFLRNYLINHAGIDASGMSDEEMRLTGEQISGETVRYAPVALAPEPAPAPAAEVVAPVQSYEVEDTRSGPVGGLTAVSQPTGEQTSSTVDESSSVSQATPVYETTSVSTYGPSQVYEKQQTQPVVDSAPPAETSVQPYSPDIPPPYVDQYSYDQTVYQPPVETSGVRDNFEQFTPSQPDVIETPADKPVVDQTVTPTAPIAPISEATSAPTGKEKSAETSTDTKAATTEPSVEAKATTSTLPSITDYQGNQYDGAQILNLARQLAENAGPMSGGVFETTDANIGFASEEANKLLGRDASTAEQVLLDMSRQLIQAGVTDLNSLRVGDIKQNLNVYQNDDGVYLANLASDPYNPEAPAHVRPLTADEVARVKVIEHQAAGEQDAWTQRVVEDFVVGRGIFSGDRGLTANIGAVASDPLAYVIGSTYTGEGGTDYQLKFDPTTNKPIVTANGFSTSDAGLIMPVIMLASNFLMPGVGSALTSSLASAGLGQVASQVVSSAIISGVTSGVMAEATGGDFGDGFLKGALTGAISAGVAPMIQTALPSDLSPMVSNALTKAGTAVVTAAASGKDPGAALTTSLLNSAMSGGLSALSGEVGLSGDEAKVLSGALSPVVTQLVTTGKVNDQTLINSVLMAGSTILANTDSNAVKDPVTLKVGDETSSTTGALTSILNDQDIDDISDIATGDTTKKVTGALSLLSNNKTGNEAIDNTTKAVGSVFNDKNLDLVTKLTSGSDVDKVTGALTLLGNKDYGNETANNIASSITAGLGTLGTAAAMGNKLTGLTKFSGPKVSTKRANLTGALGVNKTSTKVAPKTVAQTNASLAKSVPKFNPSLAKTSVAARPAPKKLDISKLTPIKTTAAPPKKMDVSKLTPVKQTAKIG